ncbi:MAG: aminoacetone oxidase family FAD-binding enzyme [Gemmatimonadales bacterium]|nr:MAG: aminoacetone oxidase family FAD-binding enzyme [Gemmatimonadales bacterium]
MDLVVVGAGAAGLMAAIAAGEATPPGTRILLLERSRDGGRKILISGGGRCNVLPSRLDPRWYFTDSSPHTLKKLLLAWPLAAQRRFFEDDLGIPLKLEEETGKLFPVSDRARDVRDALVDRARRAGVRILFETSLAGLAPGEDGSWRISLEGGGGFHSRVVLLATGGLSVPATGSDGTGLRLLEGLGHTLHPLYPALTPLLADPPLHRELAGVSLDLTLTAPAEPGKPETRGGFLFTHRGYSGPTVLDLSHFAVRSRGTKHPAELIVRWTHDTEEVWNQRFQEAARVRGGSTMAAILREQLPQRLADRLLEEAEVPVDRSPARLSREERRRLAAALGAYPLPWTGDEGYKKAEVTGGGVSLAEVEPRTLESRLCPGLFLCGELLDAFGPIGGFNFAWAWATGRTAGLGAAARLAEMGVGAPG